MDVDTLEPGDDFVEVIKGAVGSCDVLVAVIGRQWLSVAGPSGSRRLDDPEDFVRLEIEAALERKVRVVPALVDQAAMPRSSDLPGSIAALARRQSVELSHSRWEHDADRLIRAVERAIASGPPGGAGPGVEPGPATPPETGPPLPGTGTTSTEGVRAEDFAALRRGDAAARQRVEERLRGLWELVAASLSQQDRLKLGELHSAVLGASDRRASCQTNWGQVGVNLTLELAADPASQLELNVVAWTAVPAEAFEGWLRSERGRARLEQLGDYELVVYARRAHKGPSGRPYWQQTTYEAIASAPTREVDSDWLDEKLSQFRGNVWEKPAFHLRKLWPEPEVIKEGERLGSRLAAEIRRLLPLLDEANGLSAVTSSGIPIEGPRGPISSLATIEPQPQPPPIPVGPPLSRPAKGPDDLATNDETTGAWLEELTETETPGEEINTPTDATSDNKTRRGRRGPWVCSYCDRVNPKFRKVCDSCGRARPPQVPPSRASAQSKRSPAAPWKLEKPVPEAPRRKRRGTRRQSRRTTGRRDRDNHRASASAATGRPAPAAAGEGPG